MIISKACDVEIFPNLFRVTFVDMSSYFKTFSDCVDAKGKPIALTEKLSVAEIKERLNRVESKIFWISDTDDSQLIELVGYINSMEAKYNLVKGYRISEARAKERMYENYIKFIHDFMFYNVIYKHRLLANNEKEHIKRLIHE